MRRLTVIQPFLQRREREIMAKTVCKLLGLVLLSSGYGLTHLLDPIGAHVWAAYAPHNLVLLYRSPGVVLRLRRVTVECQGFCLIFGIVYLALGILGMRSDTRRIICGYADRCTLATPITLFTRCWV